MGSATVLISTPAIPVRRLRAPGAGAAPWQGRAASPDRPGPQQALAEVQAAGRPPRV